MLDEDGDLTTSTYDGANRLQYGATLGGRTTYTYDANGNQTSQTTPALDITTYVWTTQNQMSAVQLPSGDIVTYTWAPVTRIAEERQVLRDDGVDETRYVWDNQNIVREVLNSSLEAQFTYQPQQFGHLLSQRRSSTTSIYHYDALGSEIALTQGGTVSDEDRYQAFGKTVSSTGSTTNPYGWIGQLGYRKDEETGLFNLRNRDYGADQSRFFSEDPIGFDSGDSNFYRYVGNNAVNEVDPSGKSNDRRSTPAEIWKVMEKQDPIEFEWAKNAHLILEFYEKSWWDWSNNLQPIKADDGRVIGFRLPTDLSDYDKYQYLIDAIHRFTYDGKTFQEFEKERKPSTRAFERAPGAPLTSYYGLPANDTDLAAAMRRMEQRGATPEEIAEFIRNYRLNEGYGPGGTAEGVILAFGGFAAGAGARADYNARCADRAQFAEYEGIRGPQRTPSNNEIFVAPEQETPPGGRPRIFPETPTQPNTPNTFARSVEFTPSTGRTYKVFQRGDINWDQVRTAGARDFVGKTNAEAARAGLRPQLPDGSFATLHHSQQSAKGPWFEASTRYHNIRNAKNAPLHPWGGEQHPDFPLGRGPGSLREQFQEIESPEYWIWREANR